jgi:protein-L-isoaspartate(D-aspartate) O-methyltransferase
MYRVHMVSRIAAVTGRNRGRSLPIDCWKVKEERARRPFAVVATRGIMALMRYSAPVLLVPSLLCCEFSGSHGGEPPKSAPPANQTASSSSDAMQSEREAMVAEQIERRGIADPGVLEAMRRVPRHLFVLERDRSIAYSDRALPLEEEQTISQPYIVALMTELAHVGRGSVVLEVGTGSGYQAAVLTEMGVKVYSIEIVKPLARSARERLKTLGYPTIEVREGDGYDGWVEHAPFDAIVVTAAPHRIPEPLKRQLKEGGRMVVPVGDHRQELTVLTRTEKGFDTRSVIPVLFVPMTGKAQGGT